MTQERTDRSDLPWLCFVCGLDLEGLDEEPWGPSGTCPTYNFCPCCGVEFGYGDFTVAAARSRRRRWIEAGMSWEKPDRRPDDWDSERQLSTVPRRAR